MTDIFLSYSSKDVQKAQQLAEAMERNGLKVWWDRSISPGKSFDKVIESALDEATWVVVLWSSSSIDSDWVKTEAAEARDDGKLVPVLIEDVRPPLAFRRIEAAQLQGWHGAQNHDEFTHLIEVLGGTPEPRPTPDPYDPDPFNPNPEDNKISYGKKALIIGVTVAAAFLLLALIVDEFAPNGDFDTGTINLRYKGDLWGCDLKIAVDISGQTIFPSGSLFTVFDVPLGTVPYSISGRIECPNQLPCPAIGSGVINTMAGGIYDVFWERNMVDGTCSTNLKPGF